MKTGTELKIQDFAIPLPVGTTLIEASAGTGKTYTIAAIFLRLIVEHGLEVDRILVTTFTKPATAELRDRIRQLLRRAQQAFAQGASHDPLLQPLLAHMSGREALASERLRAAVRGFDLAAIDTMHAFCQRVLTRYAFESGMAADPEILSDERTLLHEVAYDYWRERFYDCPECLAAAARIRKLSASSLAGLLHDHLQKPTSRVQPVHDPQAGEELAAALRALRTCWQKESVKIRAIFLENNTWANKAHQPATVRELFPEVEECLGTDDGPLIRMEAVLHFQAANLAVKAKATAPSHPFFEQCDRLDQAAGRYRLAVETDFLAWAPGELARRKERANLLSYGDLLTRLHRELHSPRGPALVERLREQYRAALIDEFQDTDPLQNEIFSRAFADPERRLFLIGDPKQAIYGFRGADIFTYLGAAKGAAQRLTLGMNFRSTTRLVQATNTLFSREKTAFVVEGIDFQKVQASGRADSESPANAARLAPLRLWLWEEGEIPKKGEISARLTRATAAEIARLLTSGETLDGRPIRPSDLAVLTADNKQTAAMQTELRRFGVPSALLSAESVFHSREAAELLTVLHAVAQPRDARRVRAALLTDLLGLDMRQVHAAGLEGSAWELQTARFHTWHEAWQRNGFSGVFRRLLHDTGARARLLAREDGERRLTNLSHLAELLQRAALEEQLTPPALVKWLAAQMNETERVEEHEMRLERDDEAVRLVTVHKSKGLEYNIVFCPFLWTRVCGERGHQFHFHDTAGELVFELGSDDSGDAMARAEAENLAEDARLLYVALTRARHRCDLAVGRFPEQFPSAVNWVLQGAPPRETWQSAADGSVQAALEDYYSGIEAGPWRARLEELAAQSKGTIAITPVPAEEAPRYRPGGTGAPKARNARLFDGKIENDFAVSSFSSLVAEGSDDHPERFAPPWTEDTARREAVDDIHAFPSGARTGTCLHEIFEEIDFTKLDELDDFVERKLKRHGFDEKRWAKVAAGCVRDVLSVKLAGEVSLGQIPPAERLIEREFHLPAHRLEPRKLQQIMGEKGESRLEFSPRTGWLKGYIDLVFRQGERFYVVDWKSNRLGPDASGYASANVAAAMASHYYPLQARIYGVALHRYLRQRLRGYEYERHFGGMIYLFVRGISPARPGDGIWHERPGKAEIEAFDRWLEGPKKRGKSK